VVREDIESGRGGPGLNAALADLRAVIRGHLQQMRALRGGIPDATLPAFRPLALVEPYLSQMEARSYDPFRTAIELPQWRKLIALWRNW
jgi:phytoene synthase